MLVLVMLDVTNDCHLTLNDMLHAPKTSSNLISIDKLFHDNNMCWFDVKGGEVEGVNKKDIYSLQESNLSNCKIFHPFFYFPRSTGFTVYLETLHHRMGTLVFHLLKILSKNILCQFLLIATMLFLVIVCAMTSFNLICLLSVNTAN